LLRKFRIFGLFLVWIDLYQTFGYYDGQFKQRSVVQQKCIKSSILKCNSGTKSLLKTEQYPFVWEIPSQ